MTCDFVISFIDINFSKMRHQHVCCLSEQSPRAQVHSNREWTQTRGQKQIFIKVVGNIGTRANLVDFSRTIQIDFLLIFSIKYSNNVRSLCYVSHN